MKTPSFVRILSLQISVAVLLAALFIWGALTAVEQSLFALQIPAEKIQEAITLLRPHLIWGSGLLILLLTFWTFLQKEFLLAPMKSFAKAIGWSKSLSQEKLSIDSFEHQMNQLSRSMHAFHLLGQRLKEMDQTLVHAEVEKRAILESLEEGVIAVDQRGVVSYVNGKAHTLLGAQDNLQAGNILFSKAEDKISPLLTKAIEMLRKCLDADHEISGDWQQNNSWFDLLASPIVEGRGAILVLRDSTSQRKMVELGKGFIANASHELRTPITIIKGFTEILHDMPEISSAMFEDIVEKILRNCQRMEQLVKNLLLLADLDYAFQIQPFECDLVSLVEQCIHNILLVHPEVQIETLSNADEVFANIDVGLLEIALMNLLQNGVKYSKPPIKLVVTLESQAESILISVQDHGVGIPESDIEHVFDRFYTVNKAHSRKLGGAGLGLSIVKMILQKHGGSISVASKIGEGSTFTIRLPQHALQINHV